MTGTSSIKLTDQLINTIEADTPTDPVAIQYTPSPLENNVLSKETPDPIGDEKYTVCEGLIHREKNRVLFKITDTCNIYCRFCFRKEIVGKGKGILTNEQMQTAIEYIKAHKTITEVILSGGDPLTLSNRRLKTLLNCLAQISHLDNIRIHTRTPLVKPDRIDSEILDIFETYAKPLYMILHVNHAQEIHRNVEEVFRNLHKAGVILLSQSVLLKNVNNAVDTLEDLMRTLIRNRVKPYYLHHLDHAPGTDHFRVSIEEGQKLYKTLKKNISGIALPTYILDIPGGFGKIPIHSSYLTLGQNNKHIVTDYDDREHIYHD
jgi:lysine 2,3-aminomutase